MPTAMVELEIILYIHLPLLVAVPWPGPAAKQIWFSLQSLQILHVLDFKQVVSSPQLHSSPLDPPSTFLISFIYLELGFIMTLFLLLSSFLGIWCHNLFYYLFHKIQTHCRWDKCQDQQDCECRSRQRPHLTETRYFVLITLWFTQAKLTNIQVVRA